MTRRLITQDKKVVRLKEVKMQIGRKINKSGLLQHRELLAAAQRFEYKNLFVFNKLPPPPNKKLLQSTVRKS